MILSWTLRLLCILCLVAGLVLASSQLLLAVFARWILGGLDSLTARWRERILYCLQIGPALFALVVSSALFLPAYAHGETNLSGENVSVACVLLAIGLFVWFAVSLFHGVRITVRTLRMARAGCRSGRLISNTGDIPVLSLPDEGSPMRLIGFFRPRILISSRLGLLSPGALELALAHERSHAVQLDNWKLLSLSFLPRFDRLLPGGDPWSQPWQRCADWAADDDAAQGDPTRSLLLAEALVIAARAANTVPATGAGFACTALTIADAGLAIRVDRLIHPRSTLHPPGFFTLLAIAGIVAFAAMLAWVLFPWIYEFSERLLHL